MRSANPLVFLVENIKSAILPKEASAPYFDSIEPTTLNEPFAPKVIKPADRLLAAPCVESATTVFLRVNVGVLLSACKIEAGDVVPMPTLPPFLTINFV